MGIGLSHHRHTDSEYTRGHLEKVTDYFPMQSFYLPTQNVKY